jgi:type VI secretion system protein ImpC
MRFEFTFAKGPRTAPRTRDTPFRVLVLGDLDGRTSRGLRQPVSGRRPVRVDVDTFEPFLEQLRAEVQVAVPGRSAPTRIAIAEPDDLHPDRLFDRVDLFAALRRTRQRLLDRTTFEAAAAELRTWVGAPPFDPSAVAPRAPAPPTRDSDAETLERILGRAASPVNSPVKTSDALASGPVSELIHPIVAQYVVAPPPSDQQALLATVDAAIAETMRRLLHAPALQAIESAWRGLDFLVRHIETSESLQIFVLNLSREELSGDLPATGDLKDSALFRILVESTVGSPGADPWALILGFYAFGVGQDDLESLARIAALAQAADAPFVGAASGELLQTVLESPERIASESDWLALQARPEAAYLGLACPRFLLRLPYGRATDPISAFAFEEVQERRDNEAYLWAPPAVALGVFLARTFSESGWDMIPGPMFELGGLPVHVRREGSEAAAMPCAEMWLTDSQTEALFRHGLIPLQSIRGKDAVRIARVRSLREPAAALAGRWS